MLPNVIYYYQQITTVKKDFILKLIAETYTQDDPIVSYKVLDSGDCLLFL